MFSFSSKFKHGNDGVLFVLNEKINRLISIHYYYYFFPFASQVAFHAKYKNVSISFCIAMLNTIDRRWKKNFSIFHILFSEKNNWFEVVQREQEQRRSKQQKTPIERLRHLLWHCIGRQYQVENEKEDQKS